MKRQQAPLSCASLIDFRGKRTEMVITIPLFATSADASIEVGTGQNKSGSCGCHPRS